jgi:hypothetical protein
MTIQGKRVSKRGRANEDASVHYQLVKDARSNFDGELKSPLLLALRSHQRDSTLTFNDAQASPHTVGSDGEAESRFRVH